MLKEKKYCNECRWGTGLREGGYLKKVCTSPYERDRDIVTNCKGMVDNKKNNCKYFEKKIPFIKRLFGARYVTDKKN